MRTLLIILIFMMLAPLLAGCSGDDTQKLRIGDSAPVFSLKDLEGNLFDLSEMRGSPILLRFFLTDCKYCRADTPVFNDFYTKYRPQGLRVIYIDSLGVDPKVVKTFVRELGILFPVAQDMEGVVTQKYMVRALPQTIVLDPEHKIIAAILGGVSEEELQQLLSPFFAEKS